MRFIGLLLLLLSASLAQAEIRSEVVEYEDGGTRFVGYLAYDDALKGRRPGVLVVHEWWGLNDYARQRARDIAKLGYVGFAVDMYGDGRSTEDPKQAGAWAGAVRGTPLMRRHALAGLRALGRDPRVDARRLGAIGFCFGGTAVLELAYSGAKLAGVVGFHGNLPAPGRKDRIRASILALHGAADPFVRPEELAAFQAGLERAGSDWQLVSYGGAVHGFTNPAADRLGMDGVAYDARTAVRAWQAMQAFFRERLGRD